MPDTDIAAARSRSIPLTTIVLSLLAVAIGALESMPLPALPLIQRELGLDPAQAGLLSTTLILTAAVTAPIIAKLADVHGGRRLLLVITWCVVAGGAVSAFANSLPLMLVGQFLQGFGGGIVPIAFVVLREYFPNRMAVAVGLITGLFTVGGGAGVLGAGPLADLLSRQWMFLLPTLLVAVVAVAAHFALPRSTAHRRRTARLGWLGGILLAATLTTLMLTLSWIPQNGWLSLKTLGLLSLTFAFAAGWAVSSSRSPRPLIDLHMLRKRGVWGSALIAAALGAGASVAYFLVPQMLVLPPGMAGFGFGASLTEVSYYLFPSIMVAVVIGPLSGLFVRRVGSRTVVVAGLLIMASGALIAAAWHDAPWQIVLSLLLTTGIGTGAASTALYTGMIESVSESDTGVATAISGVGRAVGSALGIQVAAAVITGSSNPATQLPAEWGFQLGFALSAGLLLLALVIAYTVPGRSHRVPGTAPVTAAIHPAPREVPPPSGFRGQVTAETKAGTRSSLLEKDVA